MAAGLSNRGGTFVIQGQHRRRGHKNMHHGEESRCERETCQEFSGAVQRTLPTNSFNIDEAAFGELRLQSWCTDWNGWEDVTSDMPARRTQCLCAARRPLAGHPGGGREDAEPASEARRSVQKAAGRHEEWAPCQWRRLRLRKAALTARAAGRESDFHHRSRHSGIGGQADKGRHGDLGS